jgi:hypothetical protein
MNGIVPDPRSARGGNILRAAAGPVVALVAANLLPLWYLQHGWHASTVAMLYWWENAIVGTYAVLRILLAMKNAQDWSDGFVTRILIAGFFVLHFSGYCYGMLDVIERVFPELTDPRTDADLPETVIAALAAAHGIAFIVDYLVHGQYRRAAPVPEILRPYARVLATQILVIAGAALVRDQGQAVVLIAALILVKIAFDLAVYLVLQVWWEGSP